MNTLTQESSEVCPKEPPKQPVPPGAPSLPWPGEARRSPYSEELPPPFLPQGLRALSMVLPLHRFYSDFSLLATAATGTRW